MSSRLLHFSALKLGSIQICAPLSLLYEKSNYKLFALGRGPKCLSHSGSREKSLRNATVGLGDNHLTTPSKAEIQGWLREQDVSFTVRTWKISSYSLKNV